MFCFRDCTSTMLFALFAVDNEGIAVGWNDFEVPGLEF